MQLVGKTVEATYNAMKERLKEFVPDVELRYKAELAWRIE